MTDFESNETLSFSDASNLSSQTTSLPSSSQEHGIIRLIPPYIRDICKKPKSTELRVSFDAPTFQTTYTYSISWDDTIDSEAKYKNLLETKAVGKVSSIRSFTSLATRPPQPVPATCDGPCKRSFPSNLLNTIGRCGHYLCNACFGIVTNSDGTNGCSSLNCYWKGATREDTKKHYEREVCRKQRARARDMNRRGIDVKPASEVSGETSSDGSTTTSPLSLTSTYSHPTPSSFRLVFPSRHEMIGVKLVIVEPADDYGMLHTFAEYETKSSTKMMHALSTLMSRKKRDAAESLALGTLYYAELKPNWFKEMRRVRKRDFPHLALFDFPQIAEYVVFVLDLGGFVKKGSAIYLE